MSPELAPAATTAPAPARPLRRDAQRNRDSLVAAAEQALSMDDAWEGLCLFLETMCELQARDRGFNDFASIRLPENACLAGQQTRIHDLGVRIVERAREQGRLRPDLVPEDLAFI